MINSTKLLRVYIILKHYINAAVVSKEEAHTIITVIKQCCNKQYNGVKTSSHHSSSYYYYYFFVRRRCVVCYYYLLLKKQVFAFFPTRRPSTIDRPHPWIAIRSTTSPEGELTLWCASLYCEGERSQATTSADTGTQSVFVLPFFNFALFPFHSLNSKGPIAL